MDEPPHLSPRVRAASRELTPWPRAGYGPFQHEAPHRPPLAMTLDDWLLEDLVPQAAHIVKGLCSWSKGAASKDLLILHDGQH